MYSDSKSIPGCCFDRFCEVSWQLSGRWGLFRPETPETPETPTNSIVFSIALFLSISLKAFERTVLHSVASLTPLPSESMNGPRRG
jgi:hypothetical protein